MARKQQTAPDRCKAQVTPEMWVLSIERTSRHPFWRLQFGDGSKGFG